MAMLLVSHDFGVIAQVCDRVAVMYGGHIVETGPVETIYHDPSTRTREALLESVPELESAGQASSAAPRSPAHPPELDRRDRRAASSRPAASYARPSCDVGLDDAGAGRPGARLGLPGAAVRRANRRREGGA